MIKKSKVIFVGNQKIFYFHSILAENTSTPTEDQINPHNLLNNSISQLEHHVDILYKQATRALSHHQIIQPNFTELYSDLYYRRTMVYSQAVFTHLFLIEFFIIILLLVIDVCLWCCYNNFHCVI